MLLSKNTLQNLFLISLTVAVSFNASINPLLIQLSSISFISIFILSMRNIKVLEKIKNNYIDNKVFFIIFIIYIIYLIFQIIPLPLNWIKVIILKMIHILLKLIKN